MKNISIVLIILSLAILQAGPAAARQASSAGGASLPEALQDPDAVAAADLAAGSAYMTEPDASGSLGPARLVAEWSFDRSGNILEQASYDSDGALAHRIQYVYDSGLLVETYNHGMRIVGDFTTSMRYNTENRLVFSESTRDNGELIVRTSYSYNDRGDMTELATEARVEKASKRVLMSYDDEGRIVQTVVRDAEGKVSGRTLNSYDAGGNLLEQSSYTSEGTSISTTRNEYDSEGRLVKTVVLNPARETVQVLSHSYDSEDRLVESSASNPAAGTSSRTALQYNDKGLPSRVDTFDKLGRLASRITYRYEYAGDSRSPVPNKE